MYVYKILCSLSGAYTHTHTHTHIHTHNMYIDSNVIEILYTVRTKTTNNRHKWLKPNSSSSLLTGLIQQRHENNKNLTPYHSPYCAQFLLCIHITGYGSILLYAIQTSLNINFVECFFSSFTCAHIHYRYLPKCYHSTCILIDFKPSFNQPLQEWILSRLISIVPRFPNLKAQMRKEGETGMENHLTDITSGTAKQQQLARHSLTVQCTITIPSSQGYNKTIGTSVALPFATFFYKAGSARSRHWVGFP